MAISIQSGDESRKSQKQGRARQEGSFSSDIHKPSPADARGRVELLFASASAKRALRSTRNARLDKH
jgi:hypothetical protein